MLLTQRQSAGAHAVPAFLLRGAAVNQDGRSSALTAPNGPAQQSIIWAAFDAAAASPSVISLVQVRATYQCPLPS